MPTYDHHTPPIPIHKKMAQEPTNSLFPLQPLLVITAMHKCSSLAPTPMVGSFSLGPQHQPRSLGSTQDKCELEKINHVLIMVVNNEPRPITWHSTTYNMLRSFCPNGRLVYGHESLHHTPDALWPWLWFGGFQGCDPTNLHVHGPTHWIGRRTTQPNISCLWLLSINLYMLSPVDKPSITLPICAPFA